MLLLIVVLLVSLTLDTLGNQVTSSDAFVPDFREDYGCIHEDHSQYSDGDNLNLEYLNSANEGI